MPGFFRFKMISEKRGMKSITYRGSSIEKGGKQILRRKGFCAAVLAEISIENISYSLEKKGAGCYNFINEINFHWKASAFFFWLLTDNRYYKEIHMNLIVAPKNVDLKVLRVRDQKLDKSQITHLQNMGFVEGANCRVVSDVQGSVIVVIKGVRVGLGKDLAECIRVTV